MVLDLSAVPALGGQCRGVHTAPAPFTAGSPKFAPHPRQSSSRSLVDSPPLARPRLPFSTPVRGRIVSTLTTDMNSPGAMASPDPMMAALTLSLMAMPTLAAEGDSPNYSSRSKQTRRLVACKSCHSLKVKCTPANPDDPAGPCLRCLNANRTCEIDLTQTRKRRRKEPGVLTPELKGTTDAETIAKLQKKVDQLERLLARKQPQKPVDLPDGLVDLPPFVSKNDLEREILILVDSLSKLLDLTNSLKDIALRRTQLLTQTRIKDIVSAGHITEAEAAERLHLYRTRIYQQHPFVEIPANYGVTEMRRELPFLLNLIVSITNPIAGLELSQDKALIYDNFAVETLALEVLAVGSKLIQLIQSCLLLCLWYNSPELFRQRRYQLLNSLSVLMLHDLGIVSRPNYYYTDQGGPLSTNSYHSVNEVSQDYRAMVLVLYFSTVSICLILRRSIYVKWTPYVEECCLILERLTEKRWYNLAVFSRLSNALDKIHHIVHALEILERRNSSSLFVIHELQKLLSIIRNKISHDDHRTLAYYFSVEAYLHEPNLGQIFDGEDQENARLTTNSIRAISNCTNSCLNALDEFCKLQPQEVVTIPFFYALRIIYTAGMLLRLRFLILSVSSLIEKDLVPQKAIFAIQNVNRLVDASLLLSNHNYFLRKTRLVLQLFIQTYTSQVQELLRKNGATPQNLKPQLYSRTELSEMSRLGQLYTSGKEIENNVLTNENGQVGNQPLEILLYAAGVQRDKELQPPPPPPQQRTQQQQQPLPAPRVPTAGSSSIPPALASNPAMMARANAINAANSLPTQMGAKYPMNNMANPSRNNSMISDTLPEQLENLYLALNDEFWTDLLSQDSDKVNFSNNFNPGTGLEEVFFMS